MLIAISLSSISALHRLDISSSPTSLQSPSVFFSSFFLSFFFFSRTHSAFVVFYNYHLTRLIPSQNFPNTVHLATLPCTMTNPAPILTLPRRPTPTRAIPPPCRRAPHLSCSLYQTISVSPSCVFTKQRPAPALHQIKFFALLAVFILLSCM